MNRFLAADLLLLPSLTWAENIFELLERSADWELVEASARALAPESVQALLDAGADLEARDQYGNTPLIMAVRYNDNPEVAQLLLDAGADPSPKNVDGKAAFDLAQLNDALKGTEAYQRLNELTNR